MAFGTGAVKITPAHDENDYQCGKRHDLPMISIIDKAGLITGDCGQFAGMPRFTARVAVIEALKAKGKPRAAGGVTTEWWNYGVDCVLCAVCCASSTPSYWSDCASVCPSLPSFSSPFPFPVLPFPSARLVPMPHACTSMRLPRLFIHCHPSSVYDPPPHTCTHQQMF